MGNRFNPRARVGRDLLIARKGRAKRTFQSARPRGARLVRAARADKLNLFQSARPRGARHPRRNGCHPAQTVSIRAPAWGATGYKVRSATCPKCFNPRARVGRDIPDLCSCVKQHQFQSARPRGARRKRPGLRHRTQGVSIRAPAWGATRMIRWPSIGGRCFNPRARVGRDHNVAHVVTDNLSFNPRARVGRDEMVSDERMAELGFQSARPRGARRQCLRVAVRVNVSFNPRARVGRDTLFITRARICSRFNPRARVGRDATLHAGLSTVGEFQSARPRGARRQFCGGQGWIAAVSIRAPAWGATRYFCVTPAGTTFQSARPRGARPWSVRDRFITEKFQSARPRGARREQPDLGLGHGGFNPRARVGRDAYHADGATRWQEFQSARPRGARRKLPAVFVTCGMFQSARPRGARPSNASSTERPNLFQSARPRGARRASSHDCCQRRKFQSARPRGARPAAVAGIGHAEFVSIRAPAWGATPTARPASRRLHCFNPRARVGRDAAIPT